MSAEAVRIINSAISRCNGKTITSVDDGTPEAILADLNYEDIVRAELTASPWKFARKVDDCTLRPETPDSCRYGYAWALPDDVLKLRTLTVNGEPIDYIIASEGVVWTACSDTPQAVYTYRAPEDAWVPTFTEALKIRLEAAYLRLDERANEADSRDKAASRAFAQARLTNSQEEATHEHKRYPLISARRTGYASLRR
jgi:hypothetical protein